MNKKDKSYGVILVLRNDGEEDKFLILQHNAGHWSFPKGHGESEETPKESAIRELREEAGITDIEFTELPSIKDYYTLEKNGEKFDKAVELFIAFTKNDKVIIQESEIKDYKWATYEEALNTFTFKQLKEVLDTAQKYLKNLV